MNQADIIVIGAGPAGLSLCKSLANTGLNITVIDKLPLDAIENPKPDGREIALTHVSKQTLKELGAWDYLDEKEKYLLKSAAVINGDSPYMLNFPTPQKALGNPTDTLGYLISNHNIRKSLYEQVKLENNIHLITDTSITSVESDDQQATITTQSGEKITAKLVIAADSRFSSTRRQMGISADMHDFGRTVAVFRMRHSLSNENRATECFYYGRTLAILPLNEHLSSIVITISSEKISSVLNLDKEELRQDIMTQLDGRLGDMHLEGDIHTYPLVGVHANRFYAKRFALIGDAAVGMHPVTAHGFNLGLESQKILSDLIRQAIQNKKDYASTELLRKYSNKHRIHTTPLYHGTNLIVKLFTTENKPAKLIRKAAILSGNIFTPFKKLVSKQLTG